MRFPLDAFSPDQGTMINFSVSRPLRALIRGPGEKTNKHFVPSVFANTGSVEAAFRNSHPLFNFSRRREEGVNEKFSFSLSSSSSLFKPFPTEDVRIFNTETEINRNYGNSAIL